MDMFSLFDDSNFDAYDKQRYPEVLEAGVARHGFDLDDVLAVTQDFGLWAICRIEEVRVEPSGPHTGKLVLLDPADEKLGQIDFGGGGPNRTVEAS